MSTNFYAEMTTRTADDGEPVSFVTTIRYHIGKSSRHWIGFQGLVFPTWESWKTFLSIPNVEIYDEYRAPWDLADFVKFVEETPMAERRRQGKASLEFAPDRSWHDEEGYSFYAGMFL